MMIPGVDRPLVVAAIEDCRTRLVPSLTDAGDAGTIAHALAALAAAASASAADIGGATDDVRAALRGYDGSAAVTDAADLAAIALVLDRIDDLAVAVVAN